MISTNKKIQTFVIRKKIRSTHFNSHQSDGKSLIKKNKRVKRKLFSIRIRFDSRCIYEKFINVEIVCQSG